MKTRLLILSLSLISILSAQAQFKQIAEGPAFAEPYRSESKLLLMKNGNLLFFRLGFKDSVDVRIYNTAHEEIAVVSFEAGYSDLKEVRLEDFLEISGDVVLLLRGFEKKTGVLYRLIIDGKSGKLKKEERILELKDFWERIGPYNVSFYVKKDPETENYAVAVFNSPETKKTVRIEIAQYGGDHKESNRGYYELPAKQYEYLGFESMIVMGSEMTSVLMRGRNNSTDKREVVVASLKKGANAVSCKTILSSGDSVFYAGVIKYHPYTKKILVFANMRKPGSLDAGDVYMIWVDPQQVISDKPIQQLEVVKHPYNGLPIDIYFNKDGTFTAIHEESNQTFAGTKMTAHTETLSIHVLTYDKTGKQYGSYTIPKKFYIDFPGSPTYGSGFANQYKQVSYISRAEKSYILINDTRRNIERVAQNLSPLIIIGIGDCDAFYFPLTGTNPIPERKYLFEGSEDEKGKNLAAFGVSCYDKKNDVFIVLRLNKKDITNKTVNIVWLQPE